MNFTPNSMENNSTGNEPDNSAIILTLNEAVNDEEIISNEGKNQTGHIDKQDTISSQTSKTATIIVSVICPIAGISLIIMGLCYYRKLKNAKRADLKAQKYAFDTIKIDAIDPQILLKQKHLSQKKIRNLYAINILIIPIKATQQQSVM